MISLCLTNYNRTDLLYDSFHQVIGDDRINEIVISDDCSQVELYNTVMWQFKSIDKVKVYRNEKNLDCYLNKRRAVELASNKWVILFDSDNLLTKEYIDRVENLMVAGLNEKTVYQPEFAKPHFNFSHLAGKSLTKNNISEWIDSGNTATMLNAMNYFVNRDEYLRIFDYSIDPVTSDSIYQNYNWLKSGNSIYIVPGLEYEHRVHNGSHYQQNLRRTPAHLHSEIIDKIRQLR